MATRCPSPAESCRPSSKTSSPCAGIDVAVLAQRRLLTDMDLASREPEADHYALAEIIAGEADVGGYGGREAD